MTCPAAGGLIVAVLLLLGVTVDLTTGEAADAELARLVRLAKRDAGDPLLGSALLFNAVGGGRAGALFQALRADPAFASSRGGAAFLTDLAGAVGLSTDAGSITDLVAVLLAGAGADDAEIDHTALHRLGDQLTMAGTPLAAVVHASRAESLRTAFAAFLHASAALAVAAPHPPAARARATRALAFASIAEVRDLLRGLLTEVTPPAVQRAAVAALAAHSEPAVGDLLVAGLATLGSGARADAVVALLSRPTWTSVLLTALAERRVPAAALDLNQRHVLFDHPDPDLATRARTLLGTAISSDRGEVVERYAQALGALKGDPARGAGVFARSCRLCHDPHGVANLIGPDLRGSDRGTGALLANIIDPSRDVQGGFAACTVATRDGRLLTGLLIDENPDAVTLRLPGGSQPTVPRGNISQVRLGTRSLMPDGLETVIPPAAMADLIAYLQQLAGP